jgi:hypothetical protein
MNETPNECCGEVPTVFELRPGDWVVHCKECWDGTDPAPKKEQAIKEWNER